ncbi:MAG: polymorphic toxin type 24 domain-containing protein [bacterium]|nr:polymorphic toxin type 24 domain-containing protein [bacterium]
MLEERATNAAGAVVGEFRFDYQSQWGDWKRVATRYVHDDHLGSAGLVTNADGAEVDRVAYDPWGRARDPSDWSAYVADSATDDIPVGFTGHQAELDGGLINMRGRMYDPRLGRFMSVDPVVENAINAQTWNSYSYVQNRPLTAVDPTGLGSNDGGGGPSEGDIAKAAENAGTPGEGQCSQGESGGVKVTVCAEGAVPPPTEPMAEVAGPIGGAYWGVGDGSGIGMRGSTMLQELEQLQQLAAVQHALEEHAYQVALGNSCSGGRCTTRGLEQKTVQQAMAGAFALTQALDVASETALDVGVLLGNPYAVGASIALYAADEAAGLHDEQNAEWADLVERAGQGDDEAFEELVWKIGSSRLPGRTKGPKAKVNKLKAHPDAHGPHSTFKRDPATGKVTGHAEWDAAGNPVKRTDVTGRAHGPVKTPHTHEYGAPNVNSRTGKSYPGKEVRVRPATCDEIPK